MPLPTLSATLPEALSALTPQAIAPWLALLGFGAYHGLNPGMGWLFALSLGLQQRSERAIWVSLVPIALGHAAALALVAAVTLALTQAQLVSTLTLQTVTALALVSFGAYKMVNYYRHPRWVGMKVNLRDLAWWSFLMATAHGAGLMIVPSLLAITDKGTAVTANVALAAGSHAVHTAAVTQGSRVAGLAGGGDMALAVALHTGAMLAVMAAVAWVVYKKVGLNILRRSWFNFDLVWAAALLVVGTVALFNAALAM